MLGAALGRTISDHRGRPALVDAEAILAAARGAPKGSALREFAMAFGGAVGLAVGMSIGVPTAVLAALLRLLGVSWPAWVISVVAGAIATVAVPWGPVLQRIVAAPLLTSGNDRLLRRLLRDGRCPACSYGITGVPPESDGCVVCPECAAAWRLAVTNPA